MKRSREDWSELVAKWKRSGESVETFAEPLGIRPKTLQWWVWRLGAQKKSVERKRNAQVRMLPVSIRAAVERAPMLEIVLSDATVRFPAETSPKYIGDVLFEIKALAC